MKCIIAGSRELAGFDLKENPKLYRKHVNIFFKQMKLCPFVDQITEVVSGKARGVDTLGELWAKHVGISVKPFPADWKRYGKAAGPIRNEEMAKYADACIAIMRPNSRGTLDMVKRAKKKGLQLFVSVIEFESVKEANYDC